MKRRYLFGNCLFVDKQGQGFSTVRKSLQQAKKEAKEKVIGCYYALVISQKLINGYWKTCKTYKITN